MTADLTTRLGAAGKALEAKPNDPLLLVELLALSAAAGDRGGAQDSFKAARRFFNGGPVERRLERIVAGEVPVSEREGVFFVGPQTEESLRVCAKALDFLRAQGIAPIPVLLIECASGHGAPAATLPMVPGAAYVFLSGTGEADLYAAAVHEFGHAHLRSGNLFLDEGMAYYFELQCQAMYPDAARQSTRGAGPGTIDLRTLLAYESTDDPFFEKLLPSHGKLIHSQGALLFGRLVEKIGLAAAARVYGGLLEAGAGDNAAPQIEDALQATLEDLERDLQLTPAHRAKAGATALDPAALSRVFVAGDHAGLVAAYESIFSRDWSPARSIEGCEAELLALTSIAAEKAVDRSLTRFEYAFIKGRLSRYVNSFGKTAKYFLFRGLMSFFRAIGEENYLDGAIFLDEARVDMEMALARGPSDPEIIACLSRWEWRLPAEAGGSKERALLLMRRLAAIPGYSEIIKPTLDLCESQMP
jgi:hypothetical protein